MKTLTKQCSVEGCEDNLRAKGLCIMHYKRVQIYGDTGEAGRRRAENGEGTVNAGGYRVFNNGTKILYEHRLVMEKHLGRKLSKDEHIHHIDGDKLNNAILNLEIISNSEHQKRHTEERALNACGHKDWRKCVYCPDYSSAGNMERHGKASMCHPECRRRVRREYHNARRENT